MATVISKSKGTLPFRAPSPRSKDALLALLLVTATVAAYWPALHGGFVWDDDSHISANPTLRSLNGLYAIWFQPGATCQYYPLTFTGFWIGYHLWGLNPLGYHLLTVLMHGLVAILIWQMLIRLNVRGGFLAGAIFALHPVCVMSVAWMTELKNTLSAALALGASLAYLRFAHLGVYSVTNPGSDNPNKHQTGTDWRYYFLSLALFLLAIFAKTAVSFFPVSLFLLTWWQRKRVNGRDVLPLIPFLGVVLVMGKVTIYIERHWGGASGETFNISWLARILISGRSFWFYLSKLFFPYPLTFIYERWDINTADGWQYLYPAAMVGLFVMLWCLRRVTGKGPFTAMLHFYVSTSLVILLVVLFMTQYSFVSDHWQYFGCMSVIALAAAGITAALDFVGKGNRFLKPALCGTLLVVLGILTWRQSTIYTDVETLWNDTLAKNPNAWMAHNNWGAVLADQGRFSEAIVEYRTSLRINPDNVEAYNNLGTALVRLGRVPEALGYWEQALRIKSDYADAHNNLGIALAQVGRVKEAIGHWERALQINPNMAEAHNDLGAALMQAGKLEDAIGHFEQALRVKPDFADAHCNLGIALLRQGKVPEAMEHWEQALRLKPDYADAHYNLGIALGQAGRLNEAIRHYEQALQLKPDYADAHYRLALALKGQGRFEAAIAHYQKVLELEPRPMLAQNALAWLLATCPEASLRNGNKAVELARQAEQLSSGRHPEILDTLAAAYAEAGRFSDAVETARQALHLAEAQANAALADDIRTRLKLYETNSPYREKP